MPGIRLTNLQIVDKLRGYLKLKYGRVHYLGSVINSISEKLVEELNLEIEILLSTNAKKPIEGVLIEEVKMWQKASEGPNWRLDNYEPVNLELAMEWNLGEYEPV